MNITSISYISSLALTIFLTKYYNPNKISLHVLRYANYLVIKEATGPASQAAEGG